MFQKLVQEIRTLNYRRLRRLRFKNRQRYLARSLNRAPIETEEGFLFIRDRDPNSDVWERTERATRKLVCRLLPNVSLFVNVGANVGYYCCLAQKFGVRTVAFEPEPENCQFLCKNLEINGFKGDLELFPVAAGHPPPRIAKFFGTRNTATLSADFHRLEPGEEGPSRFVPVVRLDDIILGHRWMSNDMLLLIDVEGWEENVLKGAGGLLASDPKPLWIVEILPDPLARRPKPTEAFSIMFDSGYSAYQIHSDAGLVQVTDKSIPSLLSHEHLDSNYLFIDNMLPVPDFE